MLSTEGSIDPIDVQIKKVPFGGEMPIQRLLGQYTSGQSGSALVVPADVNGNDFRGIFAFLNVLGVLSRSNTSIGREMSGLKGNLCPTNDKEIEIWKGLTHKRSGFIGKGWGGDVSQHTQRQLGFFIVKESR